MTKRFVLDSSVFLTYASYDKIYRILDIVTTYDILIFIDDTLIDEIKNNLPKILKITTKSAEQLLTEILLFTIKVDIIKNFDGSPDPKDNFLFDLALQTKSEIIVTEEKELLLFKESPVKIKNIKWFKETFPVPL